MNMTMQPNQIVNLLFDQILTAWTFFWLVYIPEVERIVPSHEHDVAPSADGQSCCNGRGSCLGWALCLSVLLELGRLLHEAGPGMVVFMK